MLAALQKAVEFLAGRYNFTRGSIMRNQKQILWLIALSLLMLALASIANAQGAAANPQLQRQIARERAMFGLKAYLGNLELTLAQKDQVQAILAKYKSEIQALTRENVLTRRELDKAIAAGADRLALETAFAKVKEIEGNVVILRATIAQEIRQVLTADQLAKLQQKLQAVGTRLQNRPIRTGK